MVTLRNEVIRVDSTEVFELLRKQEKVRDIINDGRTLRVDNLKIEIVNCTVICEDDIPECLFDDLKD